MNAFPRPRHSLPPGQPAGPPARAAFGPPPRAERPAPAPDQSDETPPAPDGWGTLLGLAGLALTTITLAGSTPSAVAHYGAVGVGLSLLGSVLVDFRRGPWNMIRADLMCLASLYFLTLFEFVFPQPFFDTLVDLPPLRTSVIGCILCFAGLLIGRHVKWNKHRQIPPLLTYPMPQRWLFGIFWSCLFVGFLYMLIAVHFNVVAMVRAFVAPRFAQPWGRDRLGNWKALLNELGMIINLVPPLAGIMMARRAQYPKGPLLLAMLGFLFVLFYGFTCGTRNVFATFLVTFLIGFGFALPPAQRKQIFVLAGVCAALLVASTVVMLRFRDVGFANWIQGGGADMPAATEETMHVDYNLSVMSALVDYFPAKHKFLGLEVAYIAIIHPIPRALWPNKPLGLSVSMESVAGADSGWTVASSLAGESYMMGGLTGIFLTGIFFGWLAGWWNGLASKRISEFGMMIYASGFFAAVISMRSLWATSTAILPTVGGMFIGSALVSKLKAARASHDRMIARGRGRAPGVSAARRL